MAYNQRDLSGTVFRNDRMREGKQDPDFTGSAVINGESFWVDMWTKPPKDGKKGFFSLSFRPKDSGAYRGPVDHEARREARQARQHDLSKPRHMPPPSLHQSAKPEPKLDPVDEDGNHIF